MKVWMTGSKRWHREKSFIRRHFFLSTHSLATFFQATHKSGRSTRKSLSSISSLFPFLSLQLSQFSYWFASVQPLPFFTTIEYLSWRHCTRDFIDTIQCYDLGFRCWSYLKYSTKESSFFVWISRSCNQFNNLSRIEMKCKNPRREI